ncbi:putative beta-calactosidase, partial [Lojkania enalia]
MDPQRIPWMYWRDRLKKARAMGLNTIFSYVFWNLLEPTEGMWLNEGDNDIASFFRIAQEEGLNIVLRPGPYICGERDWGGFPTWLSTVPGMVVRSYNEPFLKAVDSYIRRLANDVRALRASRGGPILMIQVENEYGSFGSDHNYTSAIRDVLRRNFDLALYTNDGGEEWTLKGGSVPGVLAEIDGDPWSGFKALRQFITDPAQQGPLMNGEYYTYAPDRWGSTNQHYTSNGRSDVVKSFVKALDYILGTESASISLYMVHGATNFGFSNGALWLDKTVAFTSSYDYGSPMDESGRTTDLYYTFRETIQKYVPKGSIPEAPLDVPRSAIPAFNLAPTKLLFDILGHKTTNKSPWTMEELGQSYGFILYEYTAKTFVEGIVKPGDRARDRVLVYVDGVRKGVIDSQYQRSPEVNVQLKFGNKLQLLVENLGRVAYYSRGTPHRNYLQDPYKGILGNVTLGTLVLDGWDMYPLQLDDISAATKPPFLPSDSFNLSTPAFYRGVFSVNKTARTDPAEMDTFLAVPAGIKGNVWVNGFHLGRYWRVGPQQSLYLPGTVI